MRYFGNVKFDTICHNPVCGKYVAASSGETYTARTTVRYDGYKDEFTYCSNKCVNADYDRSSSIAESVSHYWDHIMATHEDTERMLAAHLAAFIEDDARSIEKAKAASSAPLPEVSEAEAMAGKIADAISYLTVEVDNRLSQLTVADSEYEEYEAYLQMSQDTARARREAILTLRWIQEGLM